MEYLLFAVALGGYLVVALGRVPGGSARPRWVGQICDFALWIGVLAHVVGLALAVNRTGRLPVTTPGASLASLSAVVAIGNLALRRLPRGGPLEGLVAALSVAMLGLGLILPNDVGPPVASSGVWFPIHAAMIFLGLGGFALSFGASVLFLVVRRRLKLKRLDGLGRLPSLDALDILNTRLIVLGFLALTAGIGAGGLWAASLGEHTDALGPTVYITLLLWGWYAVAIVLRVVGGWRGRLAAHFSLVGFTGLLVGLGATLLWTRGWH